MRTVVEASSIGWKIMLAVVVSYLGWWLWDRAQYSWDYQLFYYFGVGLCGMVLFSSLGNIIKALHVYQHQLQRRHEVAQPQTAPRAGDGSLLTEEEMEEIGLFDPNKGQLAGSINGRPFFPPFVHSLIISPPGQGKTTTKVVPALCHGYRIYDESTGLSRVASAVVTDLKWELYPMTARLRKEQYGHKIIILSPSHPDTLKYEPLNLVSDALSAGNIPQAISYAEMIAHILEPEPDKDDAKNKFWRLGPRAFILFTILYICDQKGRDASLIEVNELLFGVIASCKEHSAEKKTEETEEKQTEKDKLWEAIEQSIKSTAFNGELAKQAQTIREMGKYYFEHLVSTRFDLATFSSGRQVSTCMGRSDFRWHDLKSTPTTVYVGANLAEQEAFKPWLKLMVECLCIELIDTNKGGNVPVEFLLEEATNFRFDISKKLAALRGQGVRVTLIIQSYSELVRILGKQSAETIWDLTDLKNIFGGFHDVDLAEKVSRILGQRTIFSQSYGEGKDPFEDISHNVSYEKVPVVSPYDIMNTKGQIVLMQSFGNVLCEKVSYDKVTPWPHWLDENPIEGGKLSGKATISLAYENRKSGGWQKVSTLWFKRTQPKKPYSKKAPVTARYLWAGFTALYLTLAWGVVNIDLILNRTPHMLWNYNYQEVGNQKIFTRCEYLGLHSQTLISPGKCPIIRLLPSNTYFYGQTFRP